jgi:hypothetical protein
MRLRILIVVLGLVGLVTASVITWADAPDSAGPKLSIALETYTNSVSGKKLAILTIKNQDRCSVLLDAASTQVRFNDTNCYLPVLAQLTSTNLQRGKLCTAIVEVPPHHAKWGIVWEGTRLTFKEKLLSKTPWRDRGGGSFTWYTDWIPE